MLPERRHEISRVEAFSDAVFAFALFAPGYYPVFSGFSYFLMGPSHWLFARRVMHRRRNLERALEVS
jgi:hypothetical protein